jgi:hypothetical protein
MNDQTSIRISKSDFLRCLIDIEEVEGLIPFKSSHKLGDVSIILQLSRSLTFTYSFLGTSILLTFKPAEDRY